MGGSAGAQFFYRTKPVLVRRSLRTSPGLPEFVSEGGDVIVSECGSRLRMQVTVLRVFEVLPRMLVSAQVILLSMLFADSMGVRRAIV
jgi:hypothetical protein